MSESQDEPTTVHKFTKEEIERFFGNRKTFAEFLQTLPFGIAYTAMLNTCAEHQDTFNKNLQEEYLLHTLPNE